MSAGVASPQAEQFVVLNDVSWETYERLLAENNPGRGKRFTYSNGTLQIMVLSLRHELPNRLLAVVVETVAEEWESDVISTGAITIKRPDLYQGFEPDSCFYIAGADSIRGKVELDFLVDPPPDLVIEVDISRDSLDKFPIFAAAGVPEVWRFENEQVEIHVLRRGSYLRTDSSACLAPLTAAILTEFVAAGIREKRSQWLRRMRQWARSAR